MLRSIFSLALALPAAFAAPAAVVPSPADFALFNHQQHITADFTPTDKILFKRQDQGICPLEIGHEVKMCSVLHRSAAQDDGTDVSDGSTNAPTSGSSDNSTSTKLEDLVLTCLTIQRSESYLFNVLTIGPFNQDDFEGSYDPSTGQLDSDNIPPSVMAQIVELLEQDEAGSNALFGDLNEGDETIGYTCTSNKDDDSSEGDDSTPAEDTTNDDGSAPVDSGNDNNAGDDSSAPVDSGDDADAPADSGDASDDAASGDAADEETGDTADEEAGDAADEAAGDDEVDPTWVKTKHADGTIVYKFAVADVTDEMVDALCAGDISPVHEAMMVYRK